MNRAIVSGATSNIGIALVKELVNSGYQVYALVRPNSVNIDNLIKECPDCFLLRYDLEDIGKVVDTLGVDSGIESFYHLAWNKEFENARYNYEGQKINIKYTENAFRVSSAIGVKKFIGIGSQAECGIVSEPISSNTPDNPQNGYAIAKCKAYDMCVRLSKELGVSFYWGRLLSAYGIYGVHNSLINLCIDACLNRTELSLTRGEQIWDYVYADDIAKALRSIAEKGIPEKKYTIASGVGKPLKDYIRIISEVFDYPKLMDGIGKRNYSENEVMYLVGDVSEITNDTGMHFDADFRKHIVTMRNMILENR